MKKLTYLMGFTVITLCYGIYLQTAQADEGIQSEAAPTTTNPEQSTQSTQAPEATEDAESKEAEKEERAEQEEQAVKPLVHHDELSFDIEKKQNNVIELVERGLKALQSNMPFDKAAALFSHTKEYILGDLYLFVYDSNGVCLAHGEDDKLIWQNLIDLKDSFGTLIVKSILNKAKEGGGWVTYGWHNATKRSYVKQVYKDGKTYVIGSGYYPQSKQESVINIVKGAVALFNEIQERAESIELAFGLMNYPTGKFSSGDLYLYALDFNGTIMAQAERPGLTGSNAWDYKDEHGKYVNREIVKKLQANPEGIWVDYTSKRAPKRAYAEQVIDKKGTKYFIACGYYPDVDRERVVDLVRAGYQFMKTHGKSSAVDAFSSRRDDTYRYGDLFLVVHDRNGKIVAHGDIADQIGKDESSARDQDGNLYIMNMIKSATKDGFWINAKINGSFESIFAQTIDLGIESYVISCSYYPVSKPETMMLLVQSAVNFLNEKPREIAFEEFSRVHGKFVRGDLEVVVVDGQGLCYVYGNQSNVVWRNLINLKDDDGSQFIKLFINKAKNGPGVVKTRINGAVKSNYVMPVEKGDKLYVVASGFYQ